MADFIVLSISCFDVHSLVLSCQHYLLFSIATFPLLDLSVQSEKED